MRILITGASGFIGRHLKDALVSKGHTVISASRSSGTDITVWEDVSKLGPTDMVYHLAALTKGATPLEIYTLNWLGTLHVLEYARLRKVRGVIFASSYVYGRPQYLPVDEAHPILGEGGYARSKILAEGLCQAYGSESGLSIVALRLFNVYGPRQLGPEMLIPTILSQVVRGGEVILRDPTPRRDFVYVDDVVGAFVAASQDVTPGFRSYNVAAGSSISVAELVREIQDAWGFPFAVRYTRERRVNEINDSWGNNCLISHDLGWQPKVSLQDGIRRTVAWWKSKQNGALERNAI